MANPGTDTTKRDTKNVNAGAAAGPNEGPKGWIEDVRSLPMYNVKECGGKVCGYLVDAQILSGAGNVEELREGQKAFAALVVLLTAPCQAMLNKERVTVPAGREVFVHAAALSDLDAVALNPDQVYEYQLFPDVDPETNRPKEQKIKGGAYSMTMWKRFKNPTPVKRADVTTRVPEVRAFKFRELLQLAKDNGVGAVPVDTDFNPNQLIS